jgi:hypothetical protein
MKLPPESTIVKACIKCTKFCGKQCIVDSGMINKYRVIKNSVHLMIRVKKKTTQKYIKQFKSLTMIKELAITGGVSVRCPLGPGGRLPSSHTEPSGEACQ